jgi:hypothetical protein
MNKYTMFEEAGPWPCSSTMDYVKKCNRSFGLFKLWTINMNKKLTILKNQDGLGLVAGDVLDYNEVTKNYKLVQEEANTDVSKEGTYSHSYSRKVEISESVADKLVENELANIRITYSEEDSVKQLEKENELEELLDNYEEDSLSEIISRLSDLDKKVDKLIKTMRF